MQPSDQPRVSTPIDANSSFFLNAGDDYPAESELHSQSNHEPSKASSPLNDSAKMILGQSELMQRLQKIALKLSKKDLSVLIQGESGTGKEVLARFIHAHSDRRHKTFHAINCAAIPESMLESLLFGYEKGVFTGAHKMHIGKFEQAHKSTLLLDEVSEMPLELQTKLLRVLQEKEIERLGSHQSQSIDVKILASCNKSLLQCVKEGKFREDLYFRLSVFPVVIPPLRERKEDLDRFVDLFLRQYGTKRSGMTLAAFEKLKMYHWPGNIRELENVIQRALLLADDGIIDTPQICFDQINQFEINTEIHNSQGGLSFEDTLLATDQFSSQREDAYFDDTEQNVSDVERELSELDELINSSHDISQNLLVAERELIANALRKTASKKDAAEQLGISPRTLRYKLAKFKEEGIPLEIKRNLAKGVHHVQ